jgi:uncharacterized protein involved in cysteine biosynthesis
MPTEPITSQEKLDEIYRILTASESRRRSAIWYRVLKWLVIIVVAFAIANNPGYIIGRFTDIVAPIVTKQMKSVIEENKAGLMEQVKGMVDWGN